MSTKAVRVGVVGAGAVASSVHLPILTRRSDLFQVTAIADFNIDAANLLADRFGVANRFSSPDEMFSANLIDAVFILNSGSHSEVVVAALNAGLNVFCEKPLAYTREEMKAIESALNSSGKHLMIGYMKTFDPAVTAAQKIIKNRPRTVDVVVLHPSGESQLATTEISVSSAPTPKELIAKFKASERNIQLTALGKAAADAFGSFYSDVILGSVIHELSVLRALDLHITEIDFVDRWPNDGSEKAHSIIIHARTADNVRITIRWFYLDHYPLYQEEIRWVNENEGHHIIFPSPYILRVPTKLISTKRIGLDHENSITESYQPSFEIELVAFHKLVTTGEQSANPIADGNEDLEISLKIAKAICSREGITLGGNLSN
ncbi:MAG: gfo/Idh/MocA family oxidoreductase [Streptomycetaceae bacterium]|jgi:myo-inositol 2-dehydrogenase/D-chiro-inositol 1-dehydrogenase|nr:MAG: gfo/Idh/MocA family oxidoreductase [Streptomycetaceae bacterium]